MKAKVFSVEMPQIENGTIVVFSFVKSDEKNTLGSRLFASVLNGENNQYYLPIDAKGLIKLSDTAKVSANELEQIQAEFVGNVIDEVNLYDFPVTELFPNIIGFNVKDAPAEMQAITTFKRAYFGTREQAKESLLTQIKRQLHDGSLTAIKEGE